MNNHIQTAISEQGIEAYLHAQQHKSLRFLTCGSVDDGKSTLIGRLLHDSQQIYEDQLKRWSPTARSSARARSWIWRCWWTACRPSASRHHHRRGLPLFLHRQAQIHHLGYPGPRAVHPQHGHRRLHLRSGHHPDRRPQGVLDQTRRHSFIASLLGIKQFVVAVNKMDLVEFSQEVFDRISLPSTANSPRSSASTPSTSCRSALDGDNVVNPSDKLAWYQGETLLSLLSLPKRSASWSVTALPVQYVNRPNLDFRGFAGTLASGILRWATSLPCCRPAKSTVTRIVTFDGDLTTPCRVRPSRSPSRTKSTSAGRPAGGCGEKAPGDPERAGSHRLDGGRSHTAGRV
jgi:sulfate adenylyltransferase subunit 1